jgi:hypothetical protein
VNVLVCTNPVLIKTNNVLVRVIGSNVLDELFKIKYCKLIILFDRCSIETMNTGGVTAHVIFTRILSQLVRSSFDIVLRRITRFYEPDQFLGPRNEILPQTALARKGLMLRLPLPPQIPDGRIVLVSRIEPLLQSDETISIGGGDESPGENTESCAPGSFWNYLKMLKCMASKPRPETNTFYIDSGAKQCLSSCSTAFLTLEPCHIEVIGVAVSLPIFGIGTAIFALSMQGGEKFYFEFTIAYIVLGNLIS